MAAVFDDLPLPLAMLLPFCQAWRATSKHLPWEARAQRTAAQMREWGYLLSKQEAASAAEALVETLDVDVERRLSTPDALVHPESTCCVCGCSDAMQCSVVGAQSVALCSLAAEARERRVTMYRKVCSECDTDHRYSCVIAHPAVVLLHIDNPKRRPVASIELARALREELGVPTRFVHRRPSGAAITLLRGFDQHPVLFGDDPVLAGTPTPSEWSDALLAALREVLPPTRPSRRLVRYRVDVLALPAFVPHRDEYKDDFAVYTVVGGAGADGGVARALSGE